MKTYIKDLQVGDEIKDETFSVEEIQEHKTRSGNPYFRLTLQDKTGEIGAKLWQDSFPNCNMKGIDTGAVVKLDGYIDSYKGKLQLTIKRMKSTEKYDITELLQASTKDLDKMYEDIIKITKELENKHLKKLFENLFADKEIAAKFKRSPAAEMVHHDFIGGLMEHILEMNAIAVAMKPFYPEADMDIVKAGIILHDIGKIDELAVKNTALIRTVPGKLVGHIIQGIEIVSQKLPEDFPKKLWMKLQHIIASHQHHVDHEYGSPVQKATIEAAFVGVADYASSHVRQFQKAVKLGEGRDPNFSDFQKWIRTQVYLD